MKIAILSLASLVALGAAGTAMATVNTCTPVKHKAVHRTLARNTGARAPIHRTVRVLADEARATTYERPVTAPVYEREYAEAPPPVYYEEAYPGPYPVPYGPVWAGYSGPRFHGYGYGFHRGWRRW